MDVNTNETYYYAFICNDVVVRHPESYGLRAFSALSKSYHFVKDIPVNDHGMESVKDFPIIVKITGRNTVEDVITGEEYKALTGLTTSYEFSVKLGDRLTISSILEYAKLMKDDYGVAAYTEAIDRIRDYLACLNKDLNQRRLTKPTNVAVVR